MKLSVVQNCPSRQNKVYADEVPYISNGFFEDFRNRLFKLKGEGLEWTLVFLQRLNIPYLPSQDFSIILFCWNAKAEFPKLTSKSHGLQGKGLMGLLGISKFNKGKTFLRSNKQKTETFHQVMKNFLVIGQCFALMPVSGITSSCASDLKFSFWSLRVLYTLVIVFASIFMAGVNMFWVIKTKAGFDHMSPFIWYASNMFVMSSYISLAKRWPHLMQFWERVENDVTVVNTKCHQEMKRMVKLATYGIPILALTEHLLSIARGVQEAVKCKNVSSHLEAYFKLSFPGYYYSFDYNIVSGGLLQVLNLFSTFVWNYNDNFIIIVSLGLTAQFQHFNEYFNRLKKKPVADEFCGKQREYYSVLADLLVKVDENIAVIIMVSFSNNLYYICLQLFNSVATSDSIVRGVYFWFSLCYLIGRTLLVSLSAARINDESKKPVLILRMFPTESYLSEAKRFMDLVINSGLALSGMNFFHITRKFILKVAGTVVTYELVLIQLQREPAVSNDPCAR